MFRGIGKQDKKGRKERGCGAVERRGSHLISARDGGACKTASNVVTRENGACLQLNMLNGVCRGMSRRRNGAATGARWGAKGAKHHQNHRDQGCGTALDVAFEVRLTTEEGGADRLNPSWEKKGQGKGGIRRKLTSVGPAPRGDRGAARLPRG